MVSGASGAGVSAAVGPAAPLLGVSGMSAVAVSSPASPPVGLPDRTTGVVAEATREAPPLPAGVPEPSLRRYVTAIQRIAAMPDVVEKIKAQGQLIDTTSGAAYAERIQRSSRLNGEVVRLSGFKPE